MKKAAIIYWTNTGNTQKVAETIKSSLENIEWEVSLLKVKEAHDLDYFEFDLVCIGFPSYEWTTPRPMTNFLKTNLNKHRKAGLVQLGAPKVPGKYVLIFCTYSGPHTGINEAIPAGLYAGQFFEHIGFTVVDAWYVLSEFRGQEDVSTMGRMGDIRGKPTSQDLVKIKADIIKLVNSLE